MHFQIILQRLLTENCNSEKGLLLKFSGHARTGYRLAFDLKKERGMVFGIILDQSGLVDLPGGYYHGVVMVFKIFIF